MKSAKTTPSELLSLVTQRPLKQTFAERLGLMVEPQTVIRKLLQDPPVQSLAEAKALTLAEAVTAPGPMRAAAASAQRVSSRAGLILMAPRAIR